MYTGSHIQASPAFTFDAALLRPTGNEIVPHINENAPPELGNDLAYDAIKLEFDG